MNAILTTVLPVFGLIIIAYGLTKARLFPAEASRGIGLYVFNIAMPAWLFRTMAVMDFKDVAPWSLWGAFFGGMALVWVLAAFVSRHVDCLDYSGGAAAAMTAGFGNLAMLGTPLALQHFGQQISVPLGLILSIHAPVLWTAAVLHREFARHAGGPNWRAVGLELFNNLSRNAIVMALILGTLWRVAHLPLPEIFDKMLTMVSDTATPTALFALGASLAGYQLRGSFSGMAALIVLKMLAMPLMVFAMARWVFTLTPLYAHAAVLLAAMPTGANAFLFAQKNNEAVPAVSGAVAAGTGLAAITASVLLYAFDSGWM